jgi:hypothetical protein
VIVLPCYPGWTALAKRTFFIEANVLVIDPPPIEPSKDPLAFPIAIALGLLAIL